MSSILTIAILFALATILLVWASARTYGRVKVLYAEYEQGFTQRARHHLTDMFLFIDPKKLFWINVVVLVVVTLLVWVLTGSFVLAIIIATLVSLSPKFIYQRMKQNRERKFVEQLPDALIMISGSMRAGASALIAIESMCKELQPPLSQEFELFLREQKIGVDYDEALTNLAKRMPVQELDMVVAAMKISREVGGNLAEILDRLADTLRRKLQMEGKIRSLTAQGKMQGLVMTLLPVFLGFVLYLMEPDHMSRLFTEPLGWGLLAVVAIMETIGYFFIRKIVSIDV